MVEINDSHAKEMANHFRNEGYDTWANILDPKPPTLREQVYDVLISEPRGALERADAVLAVVADWLAAQPMPYPDVVTRGQRDHDVRLLRGINSD